MPKLMERAGTNEFGTITGLYTVLVEGDDFNEPISDTSRSILDGHIMLSRALAHKNHYPAIDVLQSLSRVMGDVTTPEHRECAGEIKRLMAIYKESEDLINIGAYVKGSNEEIDMAVAKNKAINTFLQQKVDENISPEDTFEAMKMIVQG